MRSFVTYLHPLIDVLCLSRSTLSDVLLTSGIKPKLFFLTFDLPPSDANPLEQLWSVSLLPANPGSSTHSCWGLHCRAVSWLKTLLMAPHNPFQQQGVCAPHTLYFIHTSFFTSYQYLLVLQSIKRTIPSDHLCQKPLPFLWPSITVNITSELLIWYLWCIHLERGWGS